ncbi:LysR family transcriptional regulator [Tateyamaria omphalii]|uniref:LysR family transcriptional regulator n=1 Tax=Tateyamaria omphalii TaxID=299262 RepID=UPI001675F464|nr:LysR family transcriptional regulator [Tateyamaria omphalii]GGX67265.1 LysR family transcriptional regulator [Tateyamaria omphalii]
MELKQLRIFLAVAEELHFGRASERLHMAQPALSAQVRTLESRLGVKLFERTTRTVSLTRAGEVFLPEAKATIAQAEAAEAAARAIGGGGGDLLKIGGVDSATAGILPQVIRAFRRAHSTVEVKIFELLSAPALHGLSNRSLDIAFVRVPPKEEFLAHRFVFSEPIMVALPADHPAATDTEVTLDTVAAEPLVIPTRSHRPILFDVIHNHFVQAGLTPRILQEANERHMIIAMVAAGLGVSLVPHWVSQFQRPDVVYRPLKGGGPMVDVHVAWRRGETLAAVDSFLTCLSKNGSLITNHSQ